MPAPFETDQIIARAAEEAGFTDIQRYRRLNVNRAVLPPQYFRRDVDYPLIRKHLKEGILVPGCSLSDEYEYKLTVTREDDPDVEG